MMEPEIRNAKVDRTMLGMEDHGILTAFVYLDYGVGYQGFGGYAFDEFDKTNDRRSGTAYGMEFIRKVLETLKIDEWERLPGTPCRAKADNGKVYAIGHYLENSWFSPEEDLAWLISTEKEAA